MFLSALTGENAYLQKTFQLKILSYNHEKQPTPYGK